MEKTENRKRAEALAELAAQAEAQAAVKDRESLLETLEEIRVMIQQIRKEAPERQLAN